MITVKNLTKTFQTPVKYPGFRGAIKAFFSRKYTKKVAVDAMDFIIESGEIVGYIGANGAGKSTTIKMMTGILTPTSGSVEVDGIIPYENREQNAREIGVVFGQRTQLWWDLPVSESFSLLKEIYQVSDADFTQRMAFLNEVLELDPFMLSPVRTLSLGQRMRADLAAALIHNPKVLYLDEPTIGLDVVVKENVRQAIQLINQQFGTTIILTTHDLNDIEELCQRIIIIDNGKKLYDGNLQAIKDRYGFMTTLIIQCKKECPPQTFTFEQLHPDADYTIHHENNQLRIVFNKQQLTSAEILASVLAQEEVVDITIKETSIEDIIKKIYRNEAL